MESRDATGEAQQIGRAGERQKEDDLGCCSMQRLYLQIPASHKKGTYGCNYI